MEDENKNRPHWDLAGLVEKAILGYATSLKEFLEKQTARLLSDEERTRPRKERQYWPE